MAAVREAMGLTGEEFAEQLGRELLRYGIARRYDKAKISRIESGRRDLLLEEALVILKMDPAKRSIDWLAVGETARTDTGSFFPKIPRSKAHGQRASAPPPKRRGGGSRS